MLTLLIAAPYHSLVPTQTVSIDEAKNQLSDLVASAAKGGEVVIVENGKALARLIAATDAGAYKSHPATPAEFSSDEDSLAWDADGWENVA